MFLTLFGKMGHVRNDLCEVALNTGRLARSCELLEINCYPWLESPSYINKICGKLTAMNDGARNIAKCKRERIMVV